MVIRKFKNVNEDTAPIDKCHYCGELCYETMVTCSPECSEEFHKYLNPRQTT